MQIFKKPIEQPWAVPKKEGYAECDGTASGLYFHFFKAYEEAKRCERDLKKRGKWIGPTRFFPGQSYHVGYI